MVAEDDPEHPEPTSGIAATKRREATTEMPFMVPEDIRNDRPMTRREAFRLLGQRTLV